jgi:hypothetical protein
MEDSRQDLRTECRTAAEAAEEGWKTEDGRWRNEDGEGMTEEGLAGFGLASAVEGGRRMEDGGMKTREGGHKNEDRGTGRASGAGRLFSTRVSLGLPRRMSDDVHQALQSAATGKVGRTASRTARARAMARSASGRSMSSQLSGYRVSMEYRLSVITWSSSMSSFRSAGICRTRNRRSWVRGTRSACHASNALRYFSAHCCA